MGQITKGATVALGQKPFSICYTHKHKIDPAFLFVLNYTDTIYTLMYEIQYILLCMMYDEENIQTNPHPPKKEKKLNKKGERLSAVRVKHKG